MLGHCFVYEFFCCCWFFFSFLSWWHKFSHFFLAAHTRTISDHQLKCVLMSLSLLVLRCKRTIEMEKQDDIVFWKVNYCCIQENRTKKVLNYFKRTKRKVITLKMWKKTRLFEIVWCVWASIYNIRISIFQNNRRQHANGCICITCGCCVDVVHIFFKTLIHVVDFFLNMYLMNEIYYFLLIFQYARHVAIKTKSYDRLKIRTYSKKPIHKTLTQIFFYQNPNSKFPHAKIKHI